MLLRFLLILCLGAQVTLGLLGPEPWSMIDRSADTFDRYVRTPPRNYVRVIKNGIRDTGRVYHPYQLQQSNRIRPYFINNMDQNTLRDIYTDFSHQLNQGERSMEDGIMGKRSVMKGDKRNNIVRLIKKSTQDGMMDNIE